MPLSTHKDSPSAFRRHRRITFDDFEVDLRSGEIRKNGSRIRLQAQPFQLLALLLANPGEVVTREEICQDLWPAGTFVDYEHSLPAAVNKIREALGDAADNPRYIETLPKRGYRFIGKISPEPPLTLAAPEASASVELTPVRTAKASSGHWSFLAGAAVVVAVALLLVWWSRRVVNSKADSQPMAVVPFTSYPGLQTTPSFSPDGSRIAFAWDNSTGHRSGKPGYDLYVKAIGSETLLRLTHHPSDWISSVWSPDGTQIAFHRLENEANGIYVVAALGGPERRLVATHAPNELSAALSWSSDGKWIAYGDTANGEPGFRALLLNVATLESQEFPHDPSCQEERFLTFSHSGQELAFVCVHNATAFELMVADLHGKARRSLTTFSRCLWGLAWSADDQSLVVSKLTFEGADGEGFAEIRVRDGEVQKLSIAAGSWPAISDDGRKLAFSEAETHVGIWRKDLQHPEVPAVQMYSSTRPQNNSQYSPDGQHVAFDSDRSGTWSVWVAESDGSNLVQISQGGPAGDPRWSPDSRKIVFSTRDADGLEGVYTADISDRVVHKLKTSVRELLLPYWSHDGNWIYFLGYQGNGHQL